MFSKIKTDLSVKKKAQAEEGLAFLVVTGAIVLIFLIGLLLLNFSSSKTQTIRGSETQYSTRFVNSFFNSDFDGATMLDLLFKSQKENDYALFKARTEQILNAIPDKDSNSINRCFEVYIDSKKEVSSSPQKPVICNDLYADSQITYNYYGQNHTVRLVVK